MTEIMPFPENNILFYWAAPQRQSFLFHGFQGFGHVDLLEFEVEDKVHRHGGEQRQHQ